MSYTLSSLDILQRFDLLSLPDKPPFSEMVIIADDDDGGTPPDLTLPVTLTGVEQPTTITLKREAERLGQLSKQESGKQ